jgi:hypothetical protein
MDGLMHGSEHHTLVFSARVTLIPISFCSTVQCAMKKAPGSRVERCRVFLIDCTAFCAGTGKAREKE